MPRKKGKHPYQHFPLIPPTPSYYHNSIYDLTIKDSLIPNAGLGVFTNSYIPAKSFIDEYTGSYHTRNTISGYFFAIHDDLGIDAREYPRCYMAMINDSYNSNYKNNCEFVVKNNRVEIWSLTDIPIHSELYISYGSDYFK